MAYFDPKAFAAGAGGVTGLLSNIQNIKRQQMLMPYVQPEAKARTGLLQSQADYYHQNFQLNYYFS